MNYVLVILALWPDPMHSYLQSHVVSTEVHWPIFTRDDCERRKVMEQRKGRQLTILAYCKREAA